MKKIFCFGEPLLRLSPVLDGKWLESSSIPVYLGGAELNVATALAGWGLPVKYGSALPDHYLAGDIRRYLEKKGIDTTAILAMDGRVGTYYLAQGADLKSAGVIYDREGSSFARLRRGMIDWNEVLTDCEWFHFSAISPALNEHTAVVCREGLEAASKQGMRISIDLNYRTRLWQYGKAPAEVMPELVEYCNIIMGNIWAADSLLGIKTSLKTSEEKTTEDLNDAAGDSMLKLHQRFPGATHLAYTFRMTDHYRALIQQGPVLYRSRSFETKAVKDKAGSGDCFMAGLIYGLARKMPVEQIVDFAAAAAVGKLQEAGDATHQTIEMILSKIENNGKD